MQTANLQTIFSWPPDLPKLRQCFLHRYVEVINGDGSLAGWVTAIDWCPDVRQYHLGVDWGMAVPLFPGTVINFIPPPEEEEEFSTCRG